MCLKASKTKNLPDGRSYSCHCYSLEKTSETCETARANFSLKYWKVAETFVRMHIPSLLYLLNSVNSVAPYPPGKKGTWIIFSLV